jgi:histidinol-phosphate phosphatase family protein
MTPTPAVFLDRDGTLIADPGFLRDPEAVALLPGAADGLRRLHEAGYLLVVISNQSGIGRGLITDAEVRAVNSAAGQLLEQAGVPIAGWYWCPHHPDAGCECRKPGTLLHRRAIDALDLDPARSWCVGDRIGDVLPAAELSARAVLVRTGEGGQHLAAATGAGVPTAADLREAATLMLSAPATRSP